MRTKLLVLIACMCAAASGRAQTTRPAIEAPESPSVLKGRPDAVSPGELLGGRFESAAAGIALNTPANCKQVKKSDDEVARFVNDEKGWELSITRSTSDVPAPLTASGQFQRSGLLELNASRLQKSGGEILRQDVIKFDQGDVGIIVARIASATQRRLFQQAIVQANDQLYYTLTLTSPGVKAKADIEDPGEKIAVETFRQMLDTVKILDRTAIKQDQDQRLFRTRAFYVNLKSDALRKALAPEQWLRLTKDGKDIGYTYVVEETSAEGASEGVKIGIRSRTVPDAGLQVDAQTWFFVSFDRRHETWSNLAFVQNQKTGEKTHMSEVGASDRKMSRVFDKLLPLGEKGDPQQPPVRPVESYWLTVTTAGKTGNTNPPFKKELPPYYLPQALGHLLPRLLPLGEQKTYMFYSYVSEVGQVMARYLDVGRDQMVDLAGQKVRAIPISDRLGLEGAPTIHYMSPEGKYLGSKNGESGIVVVPSDADTLQNVWANNANLTRPAAPANPPPPAPAQ